MKLGSLFDGIGTFPLSGLQFGFTPIWASEIEAFPIFVTKHHFPDMQHLGDITKINGAEIEPVDVITFGSPCQDMSVAGKRAGLDGERSGLFWESIRVISEMQQSTDYEYPKALVFENVPGLLSSNNGDDARLVLDALQELGFILDPNILDAQYMGVPQRRRRVFIACISLKNLLQMRTSLSKTISIECIVQILQNTWAVIQAAYQVEPSRLEFVNETEKYVISLQRKMNLLSKTLGDAPLKKLLMHSAEAQVPSGTEGSSFSDVILNSLKQNHWLIQEDILLSPLSNQIDEVVNGLESIYKTLNLNWEENLTQEKLSTILTSINKITTQQIYTFSQITLTICDHIKVLTGLSNHYLGVASSSLMLIKECINYARQSNDDLFADMEWVYRWIDYIERASRCAEQFERYIGSQCRPEVFPVSEGLRGDSTESGEAREEVAGTVGNSIKTAVGIDAYNFAESGDVAVTLTANSGSSPTHAGPAVMQRINSTPDGIAGAVSSKWAKGTGGTAGDECYNLIIEPQLYDMTHAEEVMRPVEPGIAPTLNSRMGTGGNQVPVMLAFNGRQDPVSGNIAGTLDTCGPQINAVLDTAATFQNTGHGWWNESDVAATVRTPCGGDSVKANLVGTKYAVRRLTPLECERLQGLPDGWTGIEGAKDTNRYKAIGNGIAKPCSDFVLGGIARVMKGATI